MGVILFYNFVGWLDFIDIIYGVFYVCIVVFFDVNV